MVKITNIKQANDHHIVTVDRKDRYVTYKRTVGGKWYLDIDDTYHDSTISEMLERQFQEWFVKKSSLDLTIRETELIMHIVNESINLVKDKKNAIKDFDSRCFRRVYDHMINSRIAVIKKLEAHKKKLIEISKDQKVCKNFDCTNYLRCNKNLDL